MRRQAGVIHRLEELLGTAGDAGPLEQLAEEGAAAALGGADEVGTPRSNGNEVY
jgi:hypothetical protein